MFGSRRRRRRAPRRKSKGKGRKGKGREGKGREEKRRERGGSARFPEGDCKSKMSFRKEKKTAERIMYVRVCA